MHASPAGSVTACAPMTDVNERMDFVAFVLFLWKATEHLVGVPTRHEAAQTFAPFPLRMRVWLVGRLIQDGHVRP